jgi:hypothetical protein
MKCAVAVLAFLAATVVAADTTICDVMKSPEAYDGKLVRLRATVRSGFEVFAIADPDGRDCNALWLVYPGGGPTASLSLGSSTPAAERPAVILKKDAAFAEFDRLLDATMHARRRGLDCSDCHRYEVTATLTGRVDDAGSGLGFGHMNAYRARFVLESVSAVTARDVASRYDARDYSPTPVRFPTAYLSGRVIGPDGKPVAGVQVDAVATEDVAEYLREFTEWTDDDGKYAIEVAPGSYVVSINTEDPPSPMAPFAATYARDGKRLRVSDGQHVNELDIRPRRKLVERRVPVHVVRPDGAPVAGANVWLTEVRNPYAVVGTSVSHTDACGTFDLVGFEGIDYVVHANIYGGGKRCAEPRTVLAGDKIDAPLTFVLSDRSCGYD